MKSRATDAASALERLRSVGVERLAQVAFLLPRRWDDFRGAPCALAAAAGECALFVGRLAGPLRTKHDPSRVVADFVDASGDAAKLVAFGNPHHLRRVLSGGLVVVRGRVRSSSSGSRLLSVQEVIDPAWLGRLRPVYPGKRGRLGAGAVRDAILELLPRAVPVASTELRATLGACADPTDVVSNLHGAPISLAQLLSSAHTPGAPAEGAAAQATLERVAALVTAHALRTRTTTHVSAPPIALPTLGARARAWGFALTADQRSALTGMRDDLASGLAMRRVLAGDTGSGKTAVYLTLAAAVADAGRRAVVLVPNVGLVEQVAAACASVFPDLRVTTVTATRRTARAVADAQLLVGTTALLSRPLGDVALVVVDEEHRFGAAQKHALVTGDQHLLLSSATCLPRSLALAHTGCLTVSELKTAHTPKHITTALVEAADAATLKAAVRATVARGEQVLVVYPLCGDEEDEPDRLSVAGVAPAWQRAFPGRVRALTGDDRDVDKTAAIAALRLGDAQILVATTVVQEGLHIPLLTHLVVVCPERHGLVALHQLRGRVARAGGAGRCDLYAPMALKPVTRERLELFARTTCAFELAEADLWRPPGSSCLPTAASPGRTTRSCSAGPSTPRTWRPFWTILSRGRSGNTHKNARFAAAKAGSLPVLSLQPGGDP